jgi:hypothetical protein
MLSEKTLVGTEMTSAPESPWMSSLKRTSELEKEMRGIV